VAGEALDEVSSTVSKLQSFGIKSILDYRFFSWFCMVK